MNATDGPSARSPARSAAEAAPGRSSRGGNACSWSKTESDSLRKCHRLLRQAPRVPTDSLFRSLREAGVALTGRFSFRKTFTGNCVLQLEEDVRAWWPRRMKRRWRDANLMDLARPELRPLIDLRSKP